MALSDEEWTRMYEMTVKSNTDIGWIRKELVANGKDIKACNLRMNALTNEQAFLKGKMTRITVGIASICAVVVNGVLWAFNHFGGK